jgi:hypothetical protein
MQFEELIEDGINNCPLALLSIKDKDLINKINNYLPYSIGIEIECMKSPNFNLDNFLNIPDIINVSIDDNEQRFRIQNGLSGLICLYNICDELKINSELNPDSGHHYHIDMTNTYHLLSNEFIESNRYWILEELDKWEYKGTYNTRGVKFDSMHWWMRFQNGFKTAEIRIGNMTFDYEIIIKRLIHACNIIQRLNKQLIEKETIIYTKPNFEQLKTRIKYSKYNNKLDYLNNQLLLLNKDNKETKETSNEEKRQIIKNRIIKISDN